MAEEEEIAIVREYVGEADQAGGWTDERIERFIDRNLSLFSAAADIWAVKAGNAANLVNVSESGSSRSLGDLLKQAQAMEAHYRARGQAEEAPPEPTDSGPVIRMITRQR